MDIHVFDRFQHLVLAQTVKGCRLIGEAYSDVNVHFSMLLDECGQIEKVISGSSILYGS